MIVQSLVETIKFCRAVGDPYDSQCTVQWLSPSTVNICNLSGSFTREMRRQLESYLVGAGVTKAIYVRCRNGVWSEYEINASPEADKSVPEAEHMPPAEFDLTG
ncbi:hypothetical protein [Motiliproteus sp. MSK22-1]|uniref:hypothetical protein n=1 Tax=Motiliproteus sp. MSK22-1 TaxID=1897630 RepID=UPI0009769A9F|nr:hypothetical protein [Motiliproteus sp. MSK22-1]OMH39801.1 hypothetical protein BGP75_01745 [Motiliproteus sp. MSK22-1]